MNPDNAREDDDGRCPVHGTAGFCNEIAWAAPGPLGEREFPTREAVEQALRDQHIDLSEVRLESAKCGWTAGDGHDVDRRERRRRTGVIPNGVPIGLDELLATRDRWIREHLAQRPGWWRVLARAAWQAWLEELAVMPLGEVAARMRGA